MNHTDKYPYNTLALKPYKIYLLLTAVVFFSYFNALFYPFIWDDKVLIRDNPGIRQGLGGIPQAFNPVKWGFRTDEADHAFQSFYRPFQSLASMFDYHVWGLNPFGHHLSSILFHLLNTFLVFIVTIKILRNNMVALTAAAIFATHPIHTESVTFISAKVDLICSMFFLTSLYCYISTGTQWNSGGIKNRSRIIYLLSLICFLFSLLSKEMSLTLPIIICGYSWLFESRGSRIRRIAPFFVVVVLYLLFRIFALSSFLGNHSIREDLFTLLASIVVYLSKYIILLFFPYPQRTYYTLNWYSFYSSQFLIAAPFLIIIVASLAMLFKKNKRRLFFLALWIPVTLIPVLNIGTLGEFSIAERYLYIPSIGFSIFIALCLWEFMERKGWKKYFIHITGVVVVISMTLTIFQNRVWSNDLILFENMVKGADDSPLPHSNLSSVYRYMGNITMAVKEMEKTVRLAPENPELHYDLAILYYKKGEPAKSIPSLIEAVRLDKNYSKAYNLLGVSYGELGFLEEAENQFRKALEIEPNSSEINNNLKKVLNLRSKL